MDTILAFFQKLLWGWPTLSLILFCGFYLSFRLRFFQILHIKLWFSETIRDLFSSKNSSQGSLAALSTALAGSAGTGNIIGVAVAISAAGPGVIFWMWFSAFFGMIVVFGENVLGACYREKKNGLWHGGAMYYIEKGLGFRTLALLFAGGCVLSSFGMGNMVQSGAVSQTVQLLGVPSWVIGIGLALLVFWVISGGFHRIFSLSEKMIPLITILYVVLCLIILILCRNRFLFSIRLILHEAFSLKSSIYGIGTSLFIAAKEGVSKGIFTNEAGLGSSVMAHVSSEETEPILHGTRGIFQVFLDTTVMCTLTGLCLIVTDAYHLADGTVMCTTAFHSVFGKSGRLFVIAVTLLFAFATISSWYFYGETCLHYIIPHFPLLPYRIAFAFCTFVACISSFTHLWQLSDIFNGLMAIPNLMALFLLSGKIDSETKRYLEKYRKTLAFFNKK